MLKPWGESKVLAVPGDANKTYAFCADHFLKAYEEAIATKGNFFVALSGGSTPKKIFQMLTNSPYKEKIDWTKIHLFWGDERSVPPTNAESNYRMAMDAGFGKMPIPAKHIHRMVAESDVAKGALAYEAIIHGELQGKGFDYIMLGMGDDGHTASLFPNTKALEEKDRLVIENLVPQKETTRMTLTYRCINEASHIVIYVVGEGKQERLQEILELKQELYPIQKVGTSSHKALWIIDSAAFGSESKKEQ